MSSGEQETSSGAQPGPVYDNAWRLLFEGQAAEVAAFVTGEPLESFSEARYLSAELPGTTLSADALIETGGQRLHVELQLRAEASTFEPRLVSYWARLRSMDDLPFEQHVIVMNRSGGRLSGNYRHGGLRLEYHVHHLWDLPAQDFLTHGTLFPFAVLARARNLAERGAVLQTVVDMVELAVSSGRLTSVEAARTIEIAATLASVYLKGSTITSILERSNNMTVLLREFPWSQYCREEGRVEGHEEGRVEGRQEGRQEGLDALVGVARDRHGELNERLASVLAGSSRGLKEISEMILNASDQHELERLLEG